MPRQFVLAICLVAVPAVPVMAAEPSAEAIEHFEKKVRPLLAEHCYSCHGEKKQMASLRLDTAEGLKEGADSGPVVVPGQPDKSSLILAVKRVGDYPMPPNTPLNKEQVAELETWVRLGAPFPANRDAEAATGSAKDHWAFQPMREPPLPKVSNSSSNNPIDLFVGQKLEEAKLPKAPLADKRTLIRRVYFDLIGLPPTYEEVEQFVADESADAYPKLIDKLLASPHYGERWGRHWLDVARYSDSKGYVFTEERTYPYAYTYRDYVIRSFNEDKPYDRFIIEQIAADLLPEQETNEHYAALGYLTLGRRFMNRRPDIIDDRIDVVSRGLMGLTVSCARCHDHKYDPIPIQDYYSLYGVFDSSNEPKDAPLLKPNDQSPERVAFDKELQEKQTAAEEYQAKMYRDHLAKFRTAEAVAAYIQAGWKARSLNGMQLEKLATETKLEPVVITSWKDYLNRPQAERDPVVGLWIALAKLPEAEFEGKAQSILDDNPARRGRPRWNPVLFTKLKETKPKDLEEASRAFGDLVAKAFSESAEGQPREMSQLAQILTPGGQGPTDLPVNLADKFVPIKVKQEFRRLRNAADQFKANSPNAPARAMALFDNDRPAEPVVFLRGNPNNRGPKVPRRFLELIEGEQRKPFEKGSGRLELAERIASPDNPMTARVMANRVWMHHFGQGLVRTPSDFGLRSDPPTHPELLDWLALRFIEDGWSIKKLHKRILLSETYRRSSVADQALSQADPENRLLGRQNRQRLELEPLRDSLLYVSGQLNNTLYGRSEQLFQGQGSKRRTVYGFVDRQNLPGPFRIFDFASPEQHTPQRFLTTVPQQALYLMNSEFVAQQAKALIERDEFIKVRGDEDRIRELYRLSLGRDPDAEEQSLALEFVRSHGSYRSWFPGRRSNQPWEQFAQILLMSNEFAFAD